MSDGRGGGAGDGPLEKRRAARRAGGAAADPADGADLALRARLEAGLDRLRHESDALSAAPSGAPRAAVERLLAAIDAEHAALAAASPEILTGEEPASADGFVFGREVVRVQRKLAVLRSRVLALSRARAS